LFELCKNKVQLREEMYDILSTLEKDLEDDKMRIFNSVLGNNQMREEAEWLALKDLEWLAYTIKLLVFQYRDKAETIKMREDPFNYKKRRGEETNEKT